MDEKPSSGENELVPAGWYNIWLTNEEFVDNKNKNGKILKCTFEVLSGHYKGSNIFENFNVINNSGETQITTISNKNGYFKKTPTNFSSRETS